MSDDTPETLLDAYERTDSYPSNIDHHYIQSFYFGWNLSRLDSALILNRNVLTYENVTEHLLQSLLIINDSNLDLSLIDEMEKEVENIITDPVESEEEISKEFATELEEKINDWQQRYSEAIGDLDPITTVNEGMVDTRKLVRDPESVFDEDCWNWLSNSIKQDLTDGMKALAAGLSTASMFQSLRAVEASLRLWYEYETGNQIEYDAWGSVLDKLGSEFNDYESPAVLKNLDYLREKRNEVAHPDIQPDLEHAEDTLFMALFRRFEGQLTR
jgi:hypothetical protein